MMELDDSTCLSARSTNAGTLEGRYEHGGHSVPTSFGWRAALVPRFLGTGGPWVSVRTLSPTQIRELQEHLDDAAELGEPAVEALRALAAQLDGCSVLPLIGAGGSYDCGMPLASQIGKDLLAYYNSDPRFEPRIAGLGDGMGEVAEAISIKAGQRAVVDALGLSDPALWPDAASIAPHFCVYRVLARLAREGLFAEAITFNYDCHYESGLLGEGFLLGAGATPGPGFRDRATIIPDAVAAANPAIPGSLVLRKLHGCAQHYRDELASGAEHPERQIIITDGQLVTWRGDHWARDYLRQAARENILLMIGCSGRDAVVVGELRDLLSDIYTQMPANGAPRVIAIDNEPETTALLGLIQAGLGGADAAPGAVTRVRTQPATTTAVMLALLTETLAHHLRPPLDTAALSLPDELDARMAALTIAAPVMLRWSYLLRGPQDDDFNQRTNLHATAQAGYVPLLRAPPTTVRALRTRIELRAALGHTAPESTRDALANHAFITDPARGVAYLPCGVDLATLRGGARPGGELQMTRETLPWPRHLDCVLVTDDAVGRRGINLMTGQEVSVP